MDVVNLKYVKLSRLPRLYRLLRLVKLLRFYRSNKFIDKMFKMINVSSTTNDIMKTLMAMIFILHLMGCFWATVNAVSMGDYPSNWMVEDGLQDK